ncbi:hypothetical protein, partial [uncultured Akkermansia sp.]|uniref:hypothetical protein n=1 Tax=uncultured Akkermansia sp. TaxID=512294 RepID=UPI0026363B69
PNDWQLVELRQRENPARRANKRMSCCYSKKFHSSSPNSAFEREPDEKKPRIKQSAAFFLY